MRKFFESVIIGMAIIMVLSLAAAILLLGMNACAAAYALFATALVSGAAAWLCDGVRRIHYHGKR